MEFPDYWIGRILRKGAGVLEFFFASLALRSFAEVEYRRLDPLFHLYRYITYPQLLEIGLFAICSKYEVTCFVTRVH